jgi:hypothetical protein
MVTSIPTASPERKSPLGARRALSGSGRRLARVHRRHDRIV